MLVLSYMNYAREEQGFPVRKALVHYLAILVCVGFTWQFATALDDIPTKVVNNDVISAVGLFSELLDKGSRWRPFWRMEFHHSLYFFFAAYLQLVWSLQVIGPQRGIFSLFSFLLATDIVI
jgi:hypothetical protein